MVYSFLFTQIGEIEVKIGIVTVSILNTKNSFVLYWRLEKNGEVLTINNLGHKDFPMNNEHVCFFITSLCTLVNFGFVLQFQILKP